MIPWRITAAASRVLTSSGTAIEPVRVGERELGVRALQVEGDDAITDVEVRHAGADRRDRAGPFLAGREGEWLLVDPLAVVDLDEVHPGGLDADERLAGTRTRIIDVLDPEHFRTAGLPDAYRSHRCSIAES